MKQVYYINREVYSTAKLRRRRHRPPTIMSNTIISILILDKHTTKQSNCIDIHRSVELDNKKFIVHNTKIRVPVQKYEKIPIDQTKSKNKNRSRRYSMSSLSSSTTSTNIYVVNNAYDYNTLEKTLPCTRWGD